jgi:hypothetical protein
VSIYVGKYTTELPLYLIQIQIKMTIRLGGCHDCSRGVKVCVKSGLVTRGPVVTRGSGWSHGVRLGTRPGAHGGPVGHCPDHLKVIAHIIAIFHKFVSGLEYMNTRTYMK